MSRPRGGSSEAPVASAYISTNNKWLDHEVNEMKKIHSAFLRSLDVEEIQRLQDNSTSKSDNEFFLPKDSSLRSDKGELTKPIWGGRGPFESYEEYISSLQFAYWLSGLQSQLNVDDTMNDWAKQIVKDVCNDQTQSNLRDKSSGMLGSNYKREHYCPLALMLHDLKQWCTSVLRLGKVTDRDTYMEVGRRIKFLIYLLPRDVWNVRSKLNPLSKGLPKDVHSSLVQSISRTIGVLSDVQDYTFQRYLQHVVFEKTGLLLHLMHTELFSICKFISALSTFEELIANSRERQLVQTDLIESSVTQSHSDWTVLANVCLRYCFRDKFARAALTSDMSLIDLDKEATEMLKNWHLTNPFVHRQGGTLLPPPPPPPSTKDAKPHEALPFGEVLEDPKLVGLPLCLQTCLESLNKDLAEGSSIFGSALGKHVRVPLTKEKQMLSIKKAFPNDQDRLRALKSVYKVIAALRDCVPSFFVLTQFCLLTRDDQRIMVDSVLRQELIRCIGDMVVRFSIALTATKCCIDDYSELAGSALAAMGKMEEAAQLLLNGPGVRREASTKVAVTNRKGSVVGAKGSAVLHVEDPIWVRNLDLACAELMPSCMDGAKSIFKNANELASELNHFTTTGPLRAIETSEERLCVTYCDALMRVRPDDFNGSGFLLSRIAPKKDYLNLPTKKVQETYKFASEDCAYRLESDSEAFHNKLTLLQNELQTALHPGHDDGELDADLDAIDQLAIETPASKNGRPASSAAAASAVTSSAHKSVKKSAPSEQSLVVKFDDDMTDKAAAGAKPKKRLSLFGKKLF